jgi:lysophospholipase L1-like esterase
VSIAARHRLSNWTAAVLLMAASAAAAPPPSIAPGPTSQFSFGAGGNVGDAEYTDERGFGWEPSAPSGARRFSVKLPEGNYRITTRFGDARAASQTTLRAEARRLMLEDVATEAGKFTVRSFIVNVRTPTLPSPPLNAPGGSAVRLSLSELEGLTWDDRLTLEFAGSAPRVTFLIIEPVRVPVVYLAGDSTVADQAAEGAASWGQMLPRFFKPDLAIANHASSGQTLKSFLADLRLDKILSTIRTGDWLLIQFGHNDQKTEWPQTYVDAANTYRAYLRVYIAEARRRGATPILVTSPERRNFDAAGKIVESHGAYPDAVRTVAREEGVPLIDLHALSRKFYETLGVDKAAGAFIDGGRDLTHHSDYGAEELARRVAQGIRGADPRLASHLANDSAT